MPRGSVLVKSQLENPVVNGSLAFDANALIGSIDLVDVPTAVLIPFLNFAMIDINRDLGPTMSLRIQRNRAASPLVAMLRTQELQASATIHKDAGLITDIDIIANIKSELLESISDEQLTGNVKVTLHFDRLIPVGFGEHPLVGNIALVGDMQYLPTNMNIQSLQADITAELTDPFISTSGTAMINEQATTFEVVLRSSNKDKIKGLEDLWKDITDQLPHGDRKSVV